MASKNSVKIYSENSFYHLYNRGVEKRDIFLDRQDHAVFLSYLQTYLSPKDEIKLKATLGSNVASWAEKDKTLKLLKLKNYSHNVELHCYALMSNHFHLLVKQKANVLPSFMNSLGTRYAMYFNRKYKRTGVLFQDIYKAVLIQSDEQLLHLSRYIHLNPTRSLGLPANKWRETFTTSSLAEYLLQKKTNWIKTEEILNYFSKKNSNNTYKSFLEMPSDPLFISNLAIDLEFD